MTIQLTLKIESTELIGVKTNLPLCGCSFGLFDTLEFENCSSSAIEMLQY